MFVSTDRLPSYSPVDQERHRRRWEQHQNPGLRERVLELIRNGARKNFLQGDFEAGRLTPLEDMYDLKGLKLFEEKIDFPDGDTFASIDFSYAQFYHSSFNNAVFGSSHMAFTKLYNCEFRRCIFSFNHAYAATFEKCRFIECEFVEGNTFSNCLFRSTSFDNCFIPVRLFFDCSFDQETRVGVAAAQPFRMKPISVNPKDQSDIYNGIKEAYRAGGVSNKVRDYWFLQMQAATRHNATTKMEQCFGLAKEYLAGYGVRPMRPLAAMVCVLVASSLLFSLQVGVTDGVLLAAGGLFTFGAKADLLSTLHPFYRVVYVATAFAGIALTGLFITILASATFREQ